MRYIILLLFTFISSTFFTQNIVQLNGKFILNNGFPLEGTFQNYDELGNLKFTYELLLMEFKMVILFLFTIMDLLKRTDIIN